VASEIINGHRIANFHTEDEAAMVCLKAMCIAFQCRL